MIAWLPCPVCTSNFTVHLQEIRLQRQRTNAPQYYCMNCETFFHKSGYTENSEAFQDNADFLIAHPVPYKEAEAIKNELAAHADIRDVFEAGCGVGDTLKAIRDAGYNVAGVDPNPVAIEHAVRRFGLVVECGYFAGLAKPVDAILCIDVMEHLPEPRQFFSTLVASVRDNGLIIVRVPLVDRKMWRWLRDADKDRDFDETDPFRDNSVHITHFSPRALVMMAESLGAAFDTITDAFYVFRKQATSPFTAARRTAQTIARRWFSRPLDS